MRDRVNASSIDLKFKSHYHNAVCYRHVKITRTCICFHTQLHKSHLVFGLSCKTTSWVCAMSSEIAVANSKNVHANNNTNS